MDRIPFPPLASDLIHDLRFGLDRTRRLLAIGVLAMAAVLLASISETSSQFLLAALIAFALLMIATAGRWTSLSISAPLANRTIAVETALGTILLAGMSLLLTVKPGSGRDILIAIGSIGLGAICVSHGLTNGSDQHRLDRFVLRATGLVLITGVLTIGFDPHVSPAGAVLLVAVPLLGAYLSLAHAWQDVMLRAFPLAVVGLRLATDAVWLPLLVISAGLVVLVSLQTPQHARLARNADSTGMGVSVWIGCVGLCCLAAALFQPHHLPIFFALSGATLIAIGGSGYLRFLNEQANQLRSAERHMQHLREVAELDDLTGLPLRGLLMRRLAEEVERALRYRQPLCVCFIDIDHFKEVNDKHGHGVGDVVLAQVGQLIRATIRTPDFVARYGGEEFVVIAPATWSEDARILAGRIQRELKSATFAGLAESVTISVGIASVPEHGNTVEQVLERADHALYAAKFGGRDRVEIAPEIESTPT